jgi:hypothetical protein
MCLGADLAANALPGEMVHGEGGQESSAEAEAARRQGRVPGKPSRLATLSDGNVPVAR